MYTVRGRRAIFGAVNLWCSLNNIDVKINRIGAPRFSVDIHTLPSGPLADISRPNDALAALQADDP